MAAKKTGDRADGVYHLRICGPCPDRNAGGIGLGHGGDRAEDRARSCFVYWRPVFCTFPGTGYRLEVKNGGRKGKNKVRSYAIFFDDRDALAGLVKRDPGADWEGQIHLNARSVLRVTLRGEPGTGVTLRIWGEAEKVYAGHVLGGGALINVVAQRQTGVTKAPERPQPVIALKANQEAIEIGQSIRLNWDAQNAATVRFTSGDLGWVEKSGSAMVWPERTQNSASRPGNGAMSRSPRPWSR